MWNRPIFPGRESSFTLFYILISSASLSSRVINRIIFLLYRSFKTLRGWPQFTLGPNLRKKKHFLNRNGRIFLDYLGKTKILISCKVPLHPCVAFMYVFIITVLYC